jgi:hypothetical protein
MSEPMRDDLRWFRHNLKHGAWSGLPTSMLNQDLSIDIHWFIDASDSGLAVMHPAQKQAL